jgi:hypothetical protein
VEPCILGVLGHLEVTKLIRIPLDVGAGLAQAATIQKGLGMPDPLV